MARRCCLPTSRPVVFTGMTRHRGVYHLPRKYQPHEWSGFRLGRPAVRLLLRGRSIVRFEPDGSTTTIVDRLDGQPLNTPNDLAIDRQGRIWFSNPWNAGNIDPSEKEIPGRNAILRADPQPDGPGCKRMTTDTTGTNGLLISPDQRTLYMIQTSPERRELRAYDIQDDGSLGHYIVLHHWRRLSGTAAWHRRYVPGR